MSVAVVLAWFKWDGPMVPGKCEASVLATEGGRHQCHLNATGSLEGLGVCGNHLRVLREYLEPPAGALVPLVRQLGMWEDQ